MSFTSYLSIAILSTPRPKASPLYFSESMLQFSKTIGLTIPQPRISSHFPFSDKISTSAEGSVNGKYDGRNLISTFLPNKLLRMLWIRSFKFAKDTIGCGDVFLAIFGLAYTSKLFNLVDVALISHMAAGIHANYQGNENYITNKKLIETVKNIIKKWS